jgi:prepilin-type N-terminal cleavage/methylation domain-containing protein
MTAHDAGFSLIESLISLVLLLVVMGAVFSLVTPGSISSRTQPESVDIQQRARVAIDAIERDLGAAGAGLDFGPGVGSLVNYIAPVVPRRMGLLSPDAHTIARPDAITILRTSGSFIQTTTRDPFASGALQMTLNEPPNCLGRNGVCGLARDMTILLFDPIGAFDSYVVDQVQPPSIFLVSRQRGVSPGYPAGSIVAEAEFDTYWHDPIARQLRHDDGFVTDVAVVDEVVGVGFEYFGEPGPPARPKPPLGTANCLYDSSGTATPGLSQLPAQGGSLAALPLSMFADGPWCGAGDNRFDADLLRIRQIRVTIRIQAPQPSTAPAYSATFVVSPRNLSLGR